MKLDSLSRREIVTLLGAAGIGTTVFRRALASAADGEMGVTEEMVKQAEWVAGLDLTDEQRKQAVRTLERDRRNFSELRAIPLDNSVPPAYQFRATLGERLPEAGEQRPVHAIEQSAGRKPDSATDIAFLPVTELSALIRDRQLSSTELTKIYLDRLKAFDPKLLCVVTLTEELALQQAEKADREIAAGRYRGPLHGIPWGAKDLMAYPGLPTTWGAGPYKDQMIDDKATVIDRLEKAGAIMVGKLTLGALASGDRWFGGMTRNPWNTEMGSSGSSAGSASAAVAGLVGFAIGTETHGSIVSPCRRCGATGLRPTFGRVSRHGCMTLSWTLDKIGPIARSVEDCALVFAAIQGHDPLDAATVAQPFHWPPNRDLRSLRVGFVEGDDPKDRDDLKVLKELGVQLVPIELPGGLPYRLLRTILYTESASAFDELTRSGQTEGFNSWPASFRAANFIPAIEYIRANRLRTLLMQSMTKLFESIDVYVGGNDVTLTNLTGHPTVALPHGFREENGVRRPGALTFTGRLFGETDVLSVAHAFQQATGVHLERPPFANVALPVAPE